MHPRHAHDGEALSLPVGAVVCVRLRMSFADQLLAVLRWTLGLAGAVVALWLGTALLTASPAAAAVPVVAAQAGLAKVGFSRPAAATEDGDDSDSGSSGGDDSGSDDSGNDDSGDSGSDDSDSAERSSGDESGSESDSDERSAEKDEDRSNEDESEEKESASTDESEKESSEEQARDTDEKKSDEQRDDEQAAPEQDAEENEEAAADEQNTGEQDADAPDTLEEHLEEETADASDESEEQETGQRGDESSDDESDAEDRTGHPAVVTSEQDDDAAESTDAEAATVDDATDSDSSDSDSSENELSDGDLSERDADDIEERAGADVEQTVARVVDTLTDELDESAAETDERSDEEEDTEHASDSEVATELAAEATGSGTDQSDESLDSTDVLTVDASDELDAAGDTETQPALLRTEDPADPRGPPAEAIALLSSDESDEDESRESDDEDRDDGRDDDKEHDDKDYDDSPELTERVLEGRIDVDNSKEELEQEKAKAASGEASQADYDKKAAEHAERERQASEDRAELSPDRVDLVDEVVDGHRELSKRESELDAEEQQVAAGAADRDTHEKNVADFEERRDDVYEATDELMEATDRDVRTVSEDDLDGEGAAAGCDSDGAFVGCGSASESADGKRDSDRKLCLSGVSSCGASSESGGSKAEASCDDSGCGSSASSRGADGRETRSSARCDGDASDCGQSSRANRESASAECESGGGTCRSESSGSGRDSDRSGTDRATVRLAADDESTESRVAGSGSARCESTSGCGTSSRIDMSDDGDVVADAETGCETGCTGSARTSTDASIDAAGTDARESATGATADCTVNGGSCSARSASQTDGEEGDVSASSTAGGSVDCDTACTGSATGATSGKVTGSPVAVATAVRETGGSSSCTATNGGCAAESASEVGESSPKSRSTRSAAAAEPVRELFATSTAGATVACAIEGWAGTGNSATSGAASGDVTGVRDSTGSSSCTAHGAGGTCSTASDTLVSDREPAPGETVAGVVPVSGPVSVSQASASVECAGAVGECGGTATSATSARDTAVTPDARGTSASTECTVTGGGCVGTTGSAASSANDFVATDPNTGLPLPGQPTTGPSSTADASASLACAPGTSCTGSVRTSTTARDGAVTRTSDGTASCTGATGGCEVRSVSTASSGPGAALALTGGPQQVNAARLPSGPSAASAAGATMTCAGEIACTGSVSSAATATDPLVSPTARGSHSEGSCEGVTGGVCQAVTNSGASSDPSANVIAPLVAERSTANATVSSGTTGDAPQGTQPQQEQPAAPVPAAPGSSANSGAPTVPGASSWTMANATLDCSGGGISCTGVARSSAAGSDGPVTGNGVNGARGPPTGGSTTSGSCATGATGCQAQTSATAGSGQVVADIVAEQQNDAAKQAEQQAVEAEQLAAEAARAAARPGATAAQQKTAADAAAAVNEARKAATEAAELAMKPVTDAPAAMSQSSATAKCAGAGCAASTTGDISGVAGISHTDATCTAAQSGCVVTSDASVMLLPDSGQKNKNGEPTPGHAGSGETGSSVICPDAGCTGNVNGAASVVLEQGDLRSASTGEGKTACDGSGPCQAGIRITTSAAETAAGAKEEDRSAATSVTVAASCDNGTPTGCGIHATSNSDVTGAKGVHAESTAVCAGGAGCVASTNGAASPDLAQVSYECTGAAGCTGHSEGSAAAGKAVANGSSDCRAGTNGRCAGSSMVGASTDGSAMAGASCEGTAGATCRFHFEATASDSSRDGASSAEAYAHGSMTGEMGGGAVQVMAKTHAEGAGAQAQAICQGTAGVKCGYHFEATASASSRDGASWAKAYAHGSETGEMGGGAVQVTAQAFANGPDAQASASCVGAKNCTSRYSAHAEAHDRLDQKANPSQPNMPSGYWSAHGAGTCRGSGNGGCGVHAFAAAGPGGSGGASCSGDCSNFVQEQGGPSTFTKTGPSWNEMQAAIRVHQVKDIDELIAGLEPGDSFLGYKKSEDGYTIYTKDAGGQVTTRPCPASECRPGHTINGGNGQITFQPQGNPQTSQQSTPGRADHTCNASVGCALTNHGNGNSDYWLEGNGAVGDGITGSTMQYRDNQPVGGGPANRNEGSFGNTKGKPFMFTCNGGCVGSVSNIDLGKGKFTDQIDLAGTPNMLIGRDGLGNLGDYSHEGSGTITLMKRDGSMMEPIVSGNDLAPQRQQTNGLTPEEWADVVTKYGHTPWDVDTVSRVLGPGDSLIGYRANGDGNYTIYVKEPNGDVSTRVCPATECGPGGEVIGGRGKVAFPNQGDPTASQTSAPGRADNTCTASVSCGLATDGNGNGMWWMNGDGDVHDGISGSTVSYRGTRNPSEWGNGGNWSNTDGSPFTASCAQGCSGYVGFGDTFDHFQLDDAKGVLLTSRDSLGNAGRITWAGKGYYNSAEGDNVWADLPVVAYDPNNETQESADDTTLIITRDAAGNPGYYALPTGQSGRIETIEGYVVDNRHSDQVDASNPDAYNFVHYDDTLRVITPNGDGKGGMLSCGGRCTLTGPGLDPRNTRCGSCNWTEYLATGEGAHPGGWREVSNSSGAKTWYTPTGDELTCDGCVFIQYNRDKNGNGGGAVCSGSSPGNVVACSGKSREGTAVSDPDGLRMLYANADGSHQGYSCKSNSDSCGNRLELQFDWKGDPDETWALVLDPSYLRPSTGTQMDKDLAAKLGRDEDDPLPPLTADALSYLEKTDPEAAERYKNSLPLMSWTEEAGMGFTYLERQSTDKRLQQQYGPIYDEKIKPVLDAYEAANADNALDPGERRDLDERFKTLGGIDPGLIYEWSSARGVIDGVDDATWVRPDIKEVEARLGANPELVAERAGPEPTRLQGPYYGMTPMERALENVRRDMGVDANGNPTASYNMSQNALLSFRPRQTALDLTTAGHVREVADYNRQVDVFNANPVSAAEQQRLADWKNRLDQRWGGIVGERGMLAAATKDLKGEGDQAKQDRLRGLDLMIGRRTGDDTWSDRLATANEQLAAIQEMRDGLDRNDPQQKQWAETLDALGGLASLNYSAISRNPEERADDNPLGRLSLPSTGKPDFYFAMVSGRNLPDYDSYQGALKESYKNLTRDELANLASHQSVGEYEAALRGRELQDGEAPTGDVLKAINELGGEGYKVDAERMLYRHGGQGEWQPTLVYRVTDKNGRVVGFVDLTGADFDSLTDYRNANVLPDDSHLITREDWGNSDSALTMTTAHHTSGVEKAMDYVIAPGAIVVGVVVTPFVAPVGVGLIAFGTSYFVAKSVGNIIVRAQHGQSNGFDNPAAVADYFTLAASAVGGVGSAVRPIATTAAGAVMRGTAMAAMGGMYAHSAVDTLVNWNSMTPGQQRDSIYGLTSGGLMMLAPVAARGVRAGFKPGTVPGQLGAGRSQQMGGSLGGLVLDILSVTSPRGRLTTPQQIKVGGELSLGAQIRSVVEQLGKETGRGGRMMSSGEVAAALRARGVKVPGEAALRDAINSTPGIDYVGDPSIGGIVRTGAGEFAGMRMSLEEGASTRQKVTDLLDRAGWPEATRDGKLAVSKLEQLAEPTVFREIEAAVKAEEAGQLSGMSDWLKYNANKAPNELAEAALELRDARQLASENPGMVVKVGREQNAPRRVTNEAMQEFDLSVETPAGEIKAVVEVTALKDPVVRAAQVTKAVRHAADKVVSRQRDGEPVEGSPQAVIHMRLPEGKTEGKGGSQEIRPDGTVIRLRPDGTPITTGKTTGNLFKDIENHLGASDINANVDRVTLVIQGDQRIVYVRHGPTWKKE